MAQLTTQFHCPKLPRSVCRSFMSRITVLITVFQVLLHSIVGCCADAAHATSATAPISCCHSVASSSSTSISPCQRHTGACGRTTGKSSDCQISSPDSHHQCCHDSCQWISQENPGQSISVLLIAAYLRTLNAPPLVASELSVSPAYYWTESAGFTPPMRLHLRIGVLLI
jgi:hypothetical protein